MNALRSSGFVFLLACATLFCGCGSREQNPLIGKWVSVDDEDEIPGRYVYDFRKDGSIHLIEFAKKTDAQPSAENQLGTFEIKGNAVSISWQNGKVPVQTYQINASSNGISLKHEQQSQSLVLFKTIQCQ